MPLVVEPPVRGVRWVARNGDLADRFDPDNVRELRRTARAVEVEEDELRAAVAAAREGLVDEAPEGGEPPPAALIVRAWDLPHPDRPAPPQEEWPDLWTALERSQRELFAWQGTELVAALDFDVKGGARYSEPEVGALVDEQPAPLPRVGWITKSGGLRLIFESADGLSAQERACLYVLLTSVALDDRLIRVELLPRTRRCPPGSRMVRSTRSTGVADLAGRVRAQGGEASVTMEEIQAWLEERGLGYGRHPHTVCPIDPCETSGDARNPVVIGEDGIYCYRCSGVSARGWRPWASLVGQHAGVGHDPLSALGVNLVHWTHARIVLRASYPTVPEGILRPGYEALLKLLHPEDEERRTRVFDPNLAFVRGVSCWLRADDLVPHDSIGPGSLRLLPWANGHPAKVERAMGNGTIPGYVPIQPIAHLIATPEWRAPVIFAPRPVSSVADGPPLTWDECRATFKAAMSEVSDEWILLVLGLVAGALRAQRGAPMPPISVIYAPSGSGKGAAIAAAEGILGSTRAGINLTGINPQEVGTSIGMGLESGALILFGDELGKVKGFWEKCAPLLSLCDQHVWRKLHVGMVTTPVRAHVVLAASTLPRGLTTMPEFDRRAGIFRLPRVRGGSSAHWEQGVERELGIPSLARMRDSTLGSRLAEGMIAHARRYVPDAPLVPWPIQVEAFGGTRVMQEDDDADLMLATVRGLYQAWIQGPTELLAGADERYPGWMKCYASDGSRRAPANQAAVVFEAWSSPEDAHDERTARALRLETVDVSSLLGLPTDVRLILRTHGNRAYVRFSNPLDPRNRDRTDRVLFPEVTA